MEIAQIDRIKYIKNPKKFIKDKKLSKGDILIFEDSIKGSKESNKCIPKKLVIG